MVNVTEASSRVFRVHYRMSSDLQADHQAGLVDAVRSAAARGPTAIVFVLEPGIRTVDVSIPTYWLGVTGREELKLRAMGVVSTSIGVVTAAKGFAIANVIRRIELEVRTFPIEAPALEWAKSVVERA